jgi:hypothetical protein
MTTGQEVSREKNETGFDYVQWLYISYIQIILLIVQLIKI